MNKNENHSSNEQMAETLKQVLNDIQNMQLRFCGVDTVFGYLQLPTDGQQAVMYIVVNSKDSEMVMLRLNEKRLLSVLADLNCKVPSLVEHLIDFTIDRKED